MAIAQIIVLLTTTIVSCCVYAVEVVPLALKSMIADSSDEVTMMSSSPATQGWVVPRGSKIHTKKQGIGISTPHGSGK